MKRRGKVIACSVAALGAVVLLAAGIACKKRILEEWYLWRLKSSTTTPSREIALEALVTLRSSKAIPEMAQIIEADPNLGPAAVRALLRMPKEAGPVLLTKLNAKDRASRRSLLDGIRKVKREDMAVDTAVPVLTELALHDPDGDRTAWFAMLGLKTIGQPAVNSLVIALQDKDGEVQERAANALAWLGTDATEALPALARLLEAPDQGFASIVAATMGDIGQGAERYLIPLLQDPQPAQKHTALWGLKRMDGKTPGVVASILSALKDKDRWVREDAAGAFYEMAAAKKLGGNAASTIPKLLEALRNRHFAIHDRAEFSGLFNGDPYADGRATLVAALREMGPLTDEVIPALTEALHDPNPRVCKAAGQALLSFGRGKEIQSDLISLLERGSSQVSEAALDVLRDLAASGYDVVPAIARALSDPRAEIRSSAANELGAIGPPASSAIPALVEALGNRDFDGTRFSTSIVGMILNGCEDGRLWIVQALGKVGPQSPETIPALITATRDKSWCIRQVAVYFLGEIGPSAKEAISSLKERLGDNVQSVADASSIALKKIQGQEHEAKR